MTKVINEYLPDKKLDFVVPENTIAAIITDFLGSKEKLIYEEMCYFKVDINDILQFNHLLSEKINKEHNSSINFFSAEISYSNKTKRVLNGIEDIQSYNEPSNLVPSSINLIWNIIFKFPNSENIETQKITVFFDISDDQVVDGKISLIIEHTNISWGSEIQNLFMGHIKQLITKSEEDSGLYDRLIRSNNVRTLVFVIITIIYISAFLVYHPADIAPKERNNYNEIQHAFAEKTYELSNTGKINNTDLLIVIDAIKNMNSSQIASTTSKDILRGNANEVLKNYANARNKKLEFKSIYNWSGGFLYFILVSILFLYLRAYLNYYNFKSFLLLTAFSQKKHEDHKSSANKFQFFSLSALTFAILAGLVTNAITPILYLLK